MSKSIFLLVLVLVGAACASSASRPSGDRSAPRQTASTKRGWLCDYDRSGEIRLWTAAAMSATVKDTVGTCVACCVDVTMYEETTANDIIFYRISVGSQSGWVDVDYFYWSKPSWASN